MIAANARYEYVGRGEGGAFGIAFTVFVLEYDRTAVRALARGVPIRASLFAYLSQHFID